MDKFPDDIRRDIVVANFKEKQLELLKETRKKFTDQILANLNEVITEIILEFDTRLDKKYKKIIIKELLERYIHIWLIKKGPTQVEVLVNDEQKIMSDATHIKIIL